MRHGSNHSKKKGAYRFDHDVGTWVGICAGASERGLLPERHGVVFGLGNFDLSIIPNVLMFLLTLLLVIMITGVACNGPKATPVTFSPTPTIPLTPASTPTFEPTVTPTLTPTRTGLTTPTAIPTFASTLGPVVTPPVASARPPTAIIPTPTQTPLPTPTSTLEPTAPPPPMPIQSPVPKSVPTATSIPVLLLTPTRLPSATEEPTVTSTPATTPRPTPSLGWRRIAKWSDDSFLDSSNRCPTQERGPRTARETETFHAPLNEWRISWDTMPGQSGESSFRIHIYKVFDAGGGPHGDFVVESTFGQSNGSTDIRGSGNFCLTINSSQSYTVAIEIPAGRFSELDYKKWLHRNFLRHFQDAIDITSELERKSNNTSWTSQAISAAELYTLAENNSHLVAPPSE